MNIIEIIILIIAWLLTLTWMYGVRVKPVTVTTALVNLTMLVVTLFFTFADVSKYHLLWIIPLTMFVGVRIFTFIMIHIPILNRLVSTIGKIYTEILRIGVSRNTRIRLQQEFETNAKSIIDEWALKKQKELERTKNNSIK